MARLQPFRLHHPQELLLYVVMSVLDFLATRALLQHDGSVHFGEANPVARYFLYTWGPKGMLYFKLAITAAVCILSQVIATKRPRLARGILEFGTLVVTAVVLYSAWLLLGARGHLG